MGEKILDFVGEMLEIGRQALERIVDPSCPFSDVQVLLQNREDCFLRLTKLIRNGSIEIVSSSLAPIAEQNQIIQDRIRDRQRIIETSLQSVSSIQRFIAVRSPALTSGHQIDLVL